LTIDFLGRAFHLFALSLAPRLLSPEPRSVDDLESAGGALVLGLLPALTIWMARHIDGLEARVAVGLAIAADAALLYGAHAAGPGPLLGSYYYAAPFVWSALAAIAATLAGRFLGVSFKNKRMGAAVAVLAIGIFVFKDASAFVANEESQWRKAVSFDAAHPRALAMLEPALRADVAPLANATEACLAAEPRSCLCLTWRAEARLSKGDAAGAVEDANGGAACPELEIRARAVRALALVGLGEESAAEADIGATTTSEPPHPNGELAAALVARKRGDAVGATEAAERAIRAARTFVDGWPPRSASARTKWLTHGPYRDVERRATLLLAGVRMDEKDLPGARTQLDELLSEGEDADAIYLLARVDELEGKLEAARVGYRKAVALRPGFADALYDLSNLALRLGAVAEARQAAQRMRAARPSDPRAQELELRLQGLP
jgi:tetratricopeptide (TPR) repeat protein